jgi:putative DNA primase/helicase
VGIYNDADHIINHIKKETLVEKTLKTGRIKLKNIPEQLTEYEQWVLWRYEINKQGKRTKIPKNPIIGFNASSKKPEHWGSFEDAVDNLHRADGLGFVTNIDDPFAIWDIDDCRNKKTGEIKKEAMEIVKKLNSYTEVSPSGRGLRIIVKAVIAPLGRRNKERKIEVYDSTHFLSITGRHLKGTPLIIKKRRKITNKLHRRLFRTQIHKALENKKNVRAMLEYNGIKPLFKNISA